MAQNKDSSNSVKSNSISINTGVSIPIGLFANASPIVSTAGNIFVLPGSGFAKNGFVSNIIYSIPKHHHHILCCVNYSENMFNRNAYMYIVDINTPSTPIKFTDYETISVMAGYELIIPLQKFSIEGSVMAGCMYYSTPYISYATNYQNTVSGPIYYHETYSFDSNQSLSPCINFAINVIYSISKRLSALISCNSLNSSFYTMPCWYTVINCTGGIAYNLNK